MGVYAQTGGGIEGRKAAGGAEESERLDRMTILSFFVICFWYVDFVWVLLF